MTARHTTLFLAILALVSCTSEKMPRTPTSSSATEEKHVITVLQAEG